MNKESMEGSYLVSCQSKFRVVSGAATCYLKSEHYKNGRDKLY